MLRNPSFAVLLLLDQDLYDSGLWFVIDRLATRWAKPRHLAGIVAEEHRLLTYPEFLAKSNLGYAITAVFSQSLRDMLRYFEPGGGPIALLNSGEFIQVPSMTRVGDTIYNSWAKARL